MKIKHPKDMNCVVRVLFIATMEDLNGKLWDNDINPDSIISISPPRRIRDSYYTVFYKEDIE